VSAANHHAKLPRMGDVDCVDARAHGHEPFWRRKLRALVAPTRKEDGCLQYDLHRASDGTRAFLMHEVWESRETIRRIRRRITSCGGMRGRTRCWRRGLTFWTQLV